MAKNKQKEVEEIEEKVTVEETEIEEEKETIPTEEEIKNAKNPETKLELMKKLLANQKVSENKKQKLVYKAMDNIFVVRN